MNTPDPEMAGSAYFYDIVRQVERAQALDFAEYNVLKDSAEAKLDELMRRLEGLRELRQLRETGRLMGHQLQATCLALRRAELSREHKRKARDALEYQLLYLQACLRRSIASFDAN
ncbi:MULTISPECIES: hypothetical protein [Pseudomonas]|jgi:hypothetical protein|uniref:Uncharacterized protein n=1 Tax=Pseudomonas putida TaxID=303 RepID=A0A9X8ELE5_PSEPU|nr:MULTISPECIES: hypothetical protein [Pseudomonas]KTC18026.1 hypothetical protein AO392_24055 [Pseudomonas putida]MBG8561668.1 hypothetical protein [Pseudomonas qingdaonensis]MCO7507201.1 hypothetical protein [Pseudomonas sp. VE 267-6A]MCO7532002.1 hypothetical protein [Pseudomonas sp. 2]MCP8349860.1 hypothetical protein [Pseudomonas sp. FBF18]